MGNKEDNPYYVWGSQIAKLKKDIESILNASGIYDWPNRDEEFIEWLQNTERVVEEDKIIVNKKMTEILALKECISDRFNDPPEKD